MYITINMILPTWEELEELKEEKRRRKMEKAIKDEEKLMKPMRDAVQRDDANNERHAKPRPFQTWGERKAAAKKSK